MNQKQAVVHSNSLTTYECAPQIERNNSYCMHNNLWRIIGHQPPTKSPIEIKDNSSVQDLVTNDVNIVVDYTTYFLWFLALLFSVLSVSLPPPE